MAIPAPIRVRLTLAYAATMAAVLAALGGFVYLRLGADLLQGTDLDLRARATVIDVALHQAGAAPNDKGRRLIDPDESFAQILDPAGRVLQSTTAVAGAPMLSAAEVRTVSGPTFFSRRVLGVDDPARLLAVPARAGDARLVMVVGAPLGDRAQALHRLLLLFEVGGPAALALSSLAGWVLAGVGLRPVERMRREAAAISESDLQARLAVPRTGDELARLAATLNALLGRLQEAVEREQRFVDNASHELRTPLAILKAELDLAAARPRSRIELLAAVRSAALDTDRLVRLAEDLLVLSRMRGGQLPLRRVEVSLRDLLEAVAAPFQAPPERAGIEVVAPDQVVRIDPERTRQAVHNLLDNARRHGGASGPVTVSAVCADDQVRITVADRGPGFPQAILDRVFEPYVRGPRAADGRGAGLGLTIVKAVAEAHNGEVTAANREDGSGGAVVVLVLTG